MNQEHIFLIYDNITPDHIQITTNELYVIDKVTMVIHQHRHSKISILD
jgi:hypothetical protein